MAVLVQTPAPVAARPTRRRRRRVNALGWLALALLLIVGGLALIGPLLHPLDPTAQQVEARLTGPSAAHWLGADQFGRDILARLLHGARYTLAGALAVAAGVSLVGFLVAAVSVSGGRALDGVLGRLIEALMALPGLVMALAFTAIVGPSFRGLLLALVVTNWPWYARAYRAILLRERAAPYVEGALALGAGHGRLLWRHILPNVIGPAVVLATANLGNVMLSLAALSFLGLGIQPPTPEWGAMINEARPFFQRHPWQMIAPGACIAITVLAVNLAGDALRDLCDPRGRGR